jgi:CHAD domain-containing protein
MADGKWIDGLAPDMPLPSAARHVLGIRLHVVREYLPKAIHEARDDIENVHQLRVATRRADAALCIFAACFPRKEYRRARKRLRKIRRAAGAARDWDVFLEDVHERRQLSTRPEQAGFDGLAGYALGRRRVAQQQLEEVGLEEEPGFERFMDCLLKAARRPHGVKASLSLIEEGRLMLAGRLHKLEAAASEDLTDYANLHRVRIEGKRLRYAMEVFADCFPAEFREELYPQIEAMQEVLGKANDSHVAVGEIAALREHLKRARPVEWKHWQPGVTSLLRFHQRRLPQERRRFLKLWQQWHRPETESLWECLLSEEAAAARSARA